MTDEKKMSRREWFRLRPGRAEASDKVTSARPEQSMGDVPDRLQPIAHPVNHDGMDLSELPPMREALLSEEQVRQLISDIGSVASNILLMQRSARGGRATASRTSTAEQLQAARDSLLAGTVPRVQIRYHWENADWIDTLERRDDGLRLVRIAHARATSAT